MYLVDFWDDRATQVIDWNTMNIDWQGRGWDRGLRGIAFDGQIVYIAASDELFAYTPKFELIGSFRNPYLMHCHEICVHERTLFLTSTGFDSVLGFNLDTQDFDFGLHVSRDGDTYTLARFDPAFDQGPAPSNELHLNNVYCERGGMFLSGLRTGGVLLYNGEDIRRWVSLPEGAHNARPFKGGVLFNDTQSDCVRWISRTEQRAWNVPRHPAALLTHVNDDDSKVARPGFARGLCVVDKDYIACGSSPSTVTMRRLDDTAEARIATLTLDVRNAIHGLALWPHPWVQR